MSVKQENRYTRLVISQGLEITDLQREIEAATMSRGQRRPAIPPPPNSTRRQVKIWMRRNARDFECATAIAEAANAALDLPSGAMNDEGHWVWEEAAAALDWAENEPPKGRDGK